MSNPGELGWLTAGFDARRAFFNSANLASGNGQSSPTPPWVWDRRIPYILNRSSVGENDLHAERLTRSAYGTVDVRKSAYLWNPSALCSATLRRAIRLSRKSAFVAAVKMGDG
jgi:hypothetical protein